LPKFQERRNHDETAQDMCLDIDNHVPMVVGSRAQSLYQFPEGVETRWASPENPGGEKVRAAGENAGSKWRPAVPVMAGQQLVLAEVHGSAAACLS